MFWYALFLSVYVLLTEIGWSERAQIKIISHPEHWFDD